MDVPDMRQIKFFRKFSIENDFVRKIKEDIFIESAMKVFASQKT